MAQKYAVDIVAAVYGQSSVGKFQRDLNKVEKEASKVQKVVPKASNSVVGFGRSARAASVGVKVLGAAVKSALGPLTALAAATAGLGAAFQTIQGQDFAVAKLKTLGVEADELVERLKQVSEELNGSASVAELTGAAYDVASAGFADAADNAAVLKASALGAAGGFTDMNTAGNALTSVLNAYGLSASEATKIMDQFVQTQNDGKIVVAEYAANIGKVASAAAGLGVPLSEVNAAIAQATAAGVNADVAFTGLKGALARLASGEAAKALKDAGLEINASTVAADGLIGSLKKLKDAGLDTGQIFKALGTEAAPALLPLLNNLEKTEELLKNQETAAGTAAEAQKKATDTIQGAWKQVTTAFSNFFAEQSALAELLKVSLQALATSLNIVATALNAVLGPFKGLIEVFSQVIKEVDKLGQKFKGLFGGGEDIAKANTEVGKTAAAAAKVADELDSAAEAASKFRKEQEEVTKAIKESSEELDKQAAAKESLAELTADLAKEQLNTEKLINGLLLDQAQSQLEAANNAKQKEAAAKKVYDLTIKQAQIELQTSKATIAETLRKVEAERALLEIKAKTVESEVALLSAKGQVSEELQKAVQLSREAFDLATKQAQIQGQIAGEQTKQAERLFQSKQTAAQVAYEQNRVFQSTQAAAAAAGQFAGNMQAAAGAAQQAAAAAGAAAQASGGASGGNGMGASYSFGGAGGNAYFQEMRKEAMDQFKEKKFISSRIANKEWRQMQEDLMSKSASYNRRVNEERLESARNQWKNVMNNGGNNGGSKSAVAGGVNVTTGPVMNMDNKNFITMDDFVAGLQSAAEQGADLALGTLQSSGGMRREFGVG